MAFTLRVGSSDFTFPKLPLTRPAHEESIQKLRRHLDLHSDVSLTHSTL